MRNDKYIVFKKDEFDELLKDFGFKLKDRTEKLFVSDAVVIRLQDTFAGPALHTYANSIAVTAKTLGELAPSTRDRLQCIADYFHECAIQADDTRSKLPD